MAFNITTSVTVTGTQVLSAVSDTGFVGQAASIVTAGDAVSMTGAGAALVNQGTIFGRTNGVDIDNSFHVFNSGTIAGISDAIIISVASVTTLNSRIVNTGEILSSAAIGIESTESGVDVDNSGIIQGSSAGIFFLGTDLTGTSAIVNSGTISGTIGIDCRGTMRLTNSGTIVGDVLASGGNDTIDNRFGHIAGNIALGDGLNLFRGGADDESVTAGILADTLNGGGGDDRLSSSSGNDLLGGGAGDDELLASVGDDTLSGGRGADTLDGGTGIDDLTGGADADLFVFRSLSDSPAAGGPDRILDMQRGLDLIDLASLLPANATFVGQDAFAGGGVASVRFTKATGFVLLQADADGNGTSDFHLEVYGVTALAKADLIL